MDQSDLEKSVRVLSFASAMDYPNDIVSNVVIICCWSGVVGAFHHEVMHP